MENAIVFVLRTILDLYLMTFVLRFMLQWARIDSWNPLVQFILRMTNPVVLPLRRLLPAVRGVDTATIVAALLLQTLAVLLLTRIGCVGDASVGQLLALSALSIVRLVLRIYFWAILIYVVLSWVSPGAYNPGSALLGGLVEPVLRPFRRLLPSIGGLDLSPVFAAIAIQAVQFLLPVQQALGGLLCGGLANPVL